MENDKLPIGIWEQLKYEDYKYRIFDENGDDIIVNYKEWIEFMQDYSFLTMEKKKLGMIKSIERGLKMMEEAFLEIQADRNVEFITGEFSKIRTGNGK